MRRAETPSPREPAPPCCFPRENNDDTLDVLRGYAEYRAKLVGKWDLQ
jgi:hypothetical protein